MITEASDEASKVRFIRAQTRYTIRKHELKHFLQERILDSVVFNRDIEVGRQEGHQLQSELDLKRQTLKKSEFKGVNSISPLISSFIWINSKRIENNRVMKITFHYLNLSPLKSNFTGMKMTYK